jgi:hypothetical protein
MENNIEKIILNKEYEILDKTELSAISEHIANAEEYAQVRQLLQKLKTQDEETLAPDPAIKALLINKFQSASALNIISTQVAQSKGRRIIYLRLSYAAMIAAALIIAFLLIKPSGNKENIIANKTLPKTKTTIPNNQTIELAKTQEKQVTPFALKNDTSISAIVKQALIARKDSTSLVNIAALNNNQSQIQTMKKGRSLSEDLAVLDVMYVAL